MGETTGANGFEPHELRAATLGEIHARPFAPVTTPSRILHYAFTTDSAGAVRAANALADLCLAKNLPAPNR